MRLVKKMISDIVCMCVIVCIGFEACAYTISVTARTQEKSNWCWAACAQTVGQAEKELFRQYKSYLVQNVVLSRIIKE